MDLLGTIAIIALMYVGLMGWRLRRAIVIIRAVAAVTDPFNVSPVGAKRHILVLGDSTMFGSGVKDRANTIGGRLAQEFPDASVETLAVDGARVQDLTEQMKAGKFEHYDLIMLGVGGNDIVRLTKFDQLERDLEAFLKIATAKADRLILVHCVNLGNIGFFWPPLDSYFDTRTRQLSEVYARVAPHFPTVSYVNFYRPRGNDHYTSDNRAKFITDDGFHPSDYANGYFFELIKKEAGL